MGQIPHQCSAEANINTASFPSFATEGIFARGAIPECEPGMTTAAEPENQILNDIKILFGLQ